MPLRRCATAVIVAMSCTGCGQSTAPAAPAPLLTVGDLPSGYRQKAPLPDAPVTSDRPACADALQSLEIRPSTDPGVVEQRVVFGNQVDNTVQEVVRRYPDPGAAAAAFGAAGGLSCCSGPFTVRFPQDGIQVTERVAPVPAGATVSTSWAVEVTATAQGSATVDRLTLLERGPVLAIVSVVLSFGPDPDLVTRTVAAADRRLVAAVDADGPAAAVPGGGPGRGCPAAGA